MIQRMSQAERNCQTQSGPEHHQKNSDLRRCLKIVSDVNVATLLMDGRTCISACHQRTDVVRVGICRPTAAIPPYTARTRWVQELTPVELHTKKGDGGRGCIAAEILCAAVEV